MNALEKLRLRSHWWAAFQAYNVTTGKPATGGRVLPLSANVPTQSKGKKVDLVLTPIFETREDAAQWIKAFRERHPTIVDLWDQFGPVQLTPKQVEDAFLREGVVPVQVYHEIAAEFFRHYGEGHISGVGPGPAQDFALEMQNRLRPDPQVN